MATAMRRLHYQSDRVIPASFGLYFLVSSYWLWELAEDDTSSVLFERWWPVTFVVAGVLAIAYSAAPQSRLLAAWSGGMGVGACLSRAMVILLAMHEGTIELLEARAWLTAATWVALGYAIGVIWSRFLRPLGVGRRHDRRG